MANQFNAQGSFTVRRLRNGDTLYIMLEAKPGLFQAVNKQLENNNVTTGLLKPTSLLSRPSATLHAQELPRY